MFYREMIQNNWKYPQKLLEHFETFLSACPHVKYQNERKVVIKTSSSLCNNPTRYPSGHKSISRNWAWTHTEYRWSTSRMRFSGPKNWSAYCNNMLDYVSNHNAFVWIDGLASYTSLSKQSLFLVSWCTQISSYECTVFAKLRQNRTNLKRTILDTHIPEPENVLIGKSMRKRTKASFQFHNSEGC